MRDRNGHLMDKQADRVLYLDFLRVVSMFAVVFLHSAATQYNHSEISSYSFLMANLYDSLVRWAVPVFVMISGALLLDHQKDVTIQVILTKYIRRMILAFIIWSAIYALFYNKGVSKNTIIAFITGHYHLWYLYLIIGLYLSTPIVRMVTVNRRIMEYFLLLSVVFTFLIPSVFDVIKLVLFPGNTSILNAIASAESIINDKLVFYLVLGYTPYYILGYYLKHVEISKRLEISIYTLGIIGWMVTFFLTMLASNKAGTKTNFYSYQYIGVFLESLAVYVFAKCRIGSIQANVLKKGVTFLSNVSFGVYLIHVMVLDSVYTLLRISSLPIPLVVPTATVITFFVSVAVSMAFNRIPYIRRIV